MNRLENETTSCGIIHLCRISRQCCIEAFWSDLINLIQISPKSFLFNSFYTMMIFFVETGGWSSWSNFGPCYEESYRCLHDRQRYCSHKNRNNCPGANNYGVQKQTKPCPHNCSRKYTKMVSVLIIRILETKQ